MEKTEEKYLLSNEKDELAEILFNLKYYYTGKTLKTGKRLGVFSDLLPYMSIFLYDNEDFVKSFPKGIVTEQFIFLNSKTLENILESDKIFDKNGVDQLLVKSMLNFIEYNYKVNFSNEEIKEICFNHYHYRYNEQNFNEISSYIKPLEFVKNEDLLSKVKLANITTSDTIAQIIEDNKGGKLVDITSKILLGSDEINDEKNPLSKLKSVLVNNIKESEKIDLNISEKDFESLYNDSFDILKKDKAKNILNALLNDNINNSKDVNDFVNLSKDKLITYSLLIDYLDFKVFLEKMMIQINDKFGKELPITKEININREDKNMIATNFAENEKCDEIHRELIIDEVSDYNKFTMPSRIISKLKK